MKLNDYTDKELIDIFKRSQKIVSEVFGEEDKQMVLEVAKLICEKQEHMSNRMVGKYDNQSKT